MERAPPLFKRAKRLIECLGEVPPESHSFANGLHGGRELTISQWELLKRKARHLHHDIVQCWLEGGRRDPRDVVGDLVEAISQRQLRRDLGNRKAGRLGGQSRASGDSRVHFNHDDAPGLGVHRELNVAPTSINTDQTNDRDPDVSEALVLTVCEGESRCDCDRITRVDAYWVDILNGADHHGVVRRVSHEFELILFPPQNRLFQQNLGGGALMETVGDHPNQLITVVGETRTKTTHCE